MLRDLNHRGSLATRRLFGAVLVAVLALRILAPGIPNAAPPGKIALCTGSGIVLLDLGGGEAGTGAPERLPCPAFHLAAGPVPEAPAAVAPMALAPAGPLAPATIPARAPERAARPQPRAPPRLPA